MLPFHFDYASPSAYESQKDKALLALCADGGRAVRFHGKVRPESVFLLRTALRAAFEVMWSQDYWDWEGAFETPDPLATVHPDKLFFEAFSQDCSAHVCLSVDRALFEEEGDAVCGTSNIEFTSWLWGALGEMRSARETWLRLDTVGLECRTVGGGSRFEKKGEMPEGWLRAFLELQAAATLPGTSFQVKPVDLLALIRFLRYSKPNTSPKAIRYEFEPGRPISVVAEPWERRFVLRGTEHGYDRPKATRLWGRKRLRLLEPLLPFARSVEVGLKGRAMPSFYNVRLPGIEFGLSLSGWSGKRFSQGSQLSLLAPQQSLDAKKLAKAEEKLAGAHQLTAGQLAQKIKVKKAVAEGLLRELCRRGRAGYFPLEKGYRFRPAFSQDLDLDRLFPVEPRVERARTLLEGDRVEILARSTRETRKLRKLKSPEGPSLVEVIHRDWVVEGRVADQGQVEVVLDDGGAIIFGKCGCDHFRAHLLHEGPCEHLLALRLVFEQEQVDLSTSEPAEEEGP